MGLNRRVYSQEQIVQGCVENRRKFQEILYRRHFPVMMAMIRRYTRDEDKAMEILNNGFLRVFKKIDTFSGEGSLEGWIRRIVFHCISDYFRKESKYLKFIVLEDADRDAPHSVLDDLYYEDLLQIVETIPEKSRAVFKLFAIEGYTHQEIAGMLKISAGTSKWHLSNARDHLRSLIHQRMDKNYAG